MLKFNKNPRLTTNEMIGGALMDIGIYPVTYAYRLFGLPQEIGCHGRTKNGVDLAEFIQMKYQGFTAEIRVAFDEKGGEFFEIKGSKGSINVPMFHMAKKAILTTDTKEVFEDKSLLYDLEFSHVAKEIRAGRKDGRYVTSGQTLDVMGLLDDCRRQMDVVYPMEKDISAERMEETRVTAISHMGMNVSDIEKSICFYCDIIGCREKFTLTYADMADDIEKENQKLGKKNPIFLPAIRKQGNRKWSVYLQLPGCNSFIELFDQMGMKKRKAATHMDMGFTHFSLEVNDIYAFLEKVKQNGGSEYVDTDIKKGLDNTLQMWMHDPDYNRFEIMEYTEDSYQVTGR